MKLTHELCNQFFEELPIRFKRNICAIICEYNMAVEKHPYWPADHIHAAGIVAEESGELMQAALNNFYEKGQYFKIHNEAIDTGAAVLRLLNNMPDETVTKKIDKYFKKDTEPEYQSGIKSK